jgi:hypothetical protein
MTTIGIDFSINSTAVAINKDGELTIFSFVPNYRSELAGSKMHKALSDMISVISYEKGGNTKDALADQRTKLQNADNLSDQIIEAINPYILETPQIRIEGFSFGSKGNSFIDLVSFNTFLKVKLIQIYGHCIDVVPPKSLKKIYTGNGNASKCDMLRKFLEVKDTPFKLRLVELGLDRAEEFTLPKPIDDITDAIALSWVSL